MSQLSQKGPALLLACILCTGARAFADDEESSGPGPGESSSAQMQRADDSAGEMGMEDDLEGEPPNIPPRAVPDYDGRPDPGESPGEALMWIPRVLLWPVYAILDYVVRRPLGFLLTTAERERWDALQFRPFAQTDPSWGIVPTLFIDFGFQPSGGLYLWFDDVFDPRNQVRFQIAFGGLDWLRASVLDRYLFDDTGQTHFEAKVEASMRPDRLYVGVGGDPVPERMARYGQRQIEGSFAFAFRPWRASHLRLAMGVNANEFYDGDFGTEPPLSEAVAQGLLDVPPGFDGYVGFWQRIEGSIDTRQPRPAPGSGIRLEAHVEQGVDLANALARRWLLYGGGVGAFWDIDSGRTLAFWAVADFATPLGNEAVPFTELPTLGGLGRMTAFRPGWLTGESVIAASIEYRYPIWVSIDGFLNASVGNAFGPMLGGFDVEDLRMSVALGIRTVGDPDQSLTVQFGVGTERFRNGADLVVYRLSIGTQDGF